MREVILWGKAGQARALHECVFGAGEPRLTIGCDTIVGVAPVVTTDVLAGAVGMGVHARIKPGPLRRSPAPR